MLPRSLKLTLTPDCDLNLSKESQILQVRHHSVMLYFSAKFDEIHFSSFELVSRHNLTCDSDLRNGNQNFVYDLHTCQLSPINRGSPYFQTAFRPPDRISKITQLSHFLDHLPISIFIAKLKKSRRFLSFVFSCVLQFFKVKVGLTSTWTPEFPISSGSFRQWYAVITIGSPTEEGL